jgi:predicted nucleic acid-binding Zn ribbon protein
MLEKFFGKADHSKAGHRPCPICGRAVEPQATRCDGCGRTIGMPRTLRAVRRDQVKLAPIPLGESPPDDD